jgi:hypothetical protein
MADDFKYDVFLSHSTKDKAVVHAVAERLRADGLHVWFDEWVLKPGDSLPKKLDDGLEESRVLVLFMSANAFGSDWAQLESGTFRFRDPLNKERRFIPLRLDESPIKGSLAQFLYINWLPEPQKQEYTKLLEACRPSAKQPVTATLLTEEGSPIAAKSDGEGTLRPPISPPSPLLKQQKLVDRPAIKQKVVATAGEDVWLAMLPSFRRLCDVADGKTTEPGKYYDSE